MIISMAVVNSEKAQYFKTEIKMKIVKLCLKKF